MDLIQVDKNKCISCGCCVNVCSMGVLEMGNHGPQVAQHTCNSCGHCVAVCPTEALDHINAPLASQITADNSTCMDEHMAAHFLRTRRSIRNYQQKAVPRGKIQQLLDITRFAPAGGNIRNVSYHIIDNADTLRSITAEFMDWAEEAAKHPSPWSGLLSARANAYRKNGRDGLFWSAPCLILAIESKGSFDLGKENTSYALDYVQLYAQSMGLGTCKISAIEACANSGYEPVIRLLNLPENTHITGAIIAGYPQYQYKRLVDRPALQLSWASTLENQ